MRNVYGKRIRGYEQRLLSFTYLFRETCIEREYEDTSKNYYPSLTCFKKDISTIFPIIRSAAASFAWPVHKTKRTNEMTCFKASGTSP
jgi:hypothetical protein